MIRVAIVGAGHMGRLHLIKLAKRAQLQRDVEIAAVVDIHPERALELARSVGAPSAAELAPALEKSDAAIIAVPTSSHVDVAEQALGAGVHVLLEKPIALNASQAEKLVRHASSLGLVLQIGHLEWLNPALRAARAQAGSSDTLRPHLLEANRVGPYPHRSLDIDVVRDVMIHDIDIAQNLAGGEPVSVCARGARVRSSCVDVASAELVFASGLRAALHASRVSSFAQREIRLTCAGETLVLDLLAPRLHRIPHGSEAIEVDVQANGHALLPSEDALEAQLAAFLAAVRGRAPVQAGAPGSPEAALAALRTAERVLGAMAIGSAAAGK